MQSRSSTRSLACVMERAACPAGPGNVTAFKSGVKNRTYNADNQLVNPGFVYDGNGSPTTYNVKLLGYDPEQRMTSFGTTQTATYDGDGLRAWKQKGALSTRTYYLYDGSVPVCEFSSTGALTATNTFAGGGLVSRRVGSTTTYYAFDERGNVSQRLSSTGAVVSSDLYDGYGARQSTVAIQPDPFGYGGEFGYFTDNETGLVLCTHRYYDPAAGRFVTRDPIGYAGGVNLYGYTKNNPSNRADPSGLDDYDPVSAYWNQLGNEVQQKTTQAAKSWNNAFGALGEWLGGSGSNRRNYGENSSQSNDMKNSMGGDQIALAIALGNSHGNVSTPQAFYNSINEPWNGTQAQVGGFIWDSHLNKCGATEVHIYNRMSFNSFFYHGLGFIPLPEYNRFSWGYGPMGNIHQDYYYTLR